MTVMTKPQIPQPQTSTRTATTTCHTTTCHKIGPCIKDKGACKDHRCMYNYSNPYGKSPRKKKLLIHVNHY